MVNKNRGLGERVTFMTDKNQREWLSQESETTGAPLGEIIRRAIDDYIAKKKNEQRPKFIQIPSRLA
jgi:hypothetical protein